MIMYQRVPLSDALVISGPVCKLSPTLCSLHRDFQRHMKVLNV